VVSNAKWGERDAVVAGVRHRVGPHGLLQPAADGLSFCSRKIGRRWRGQNCLHFAHFWVDIVAGFAGSDSLRAESWPLNFSDMRSIWDHNPQIGLMVLFFNYGLERYGVALAGWLQTAVPAVGGLPAARRR